MEDWEKMDEDGFPILTFYPVRKPRCSQRG